jgi:hypothetical protein
MNIFWRPQLEFRRFAVRHFGLRQKTFRGTRITHIIWSFKYIVWRVYLCTMYVPRYIIGVKNGWLLSLAIKAHPWGPSSPQGPSKFTPWGQVHPWGTRSPLGDKVTPRDMRFTPWGLVHPWGPRSPLGYAALTKDLELNVLFGILADPVGGRAPVDAGVPPAHHPQRQLHSIVGQIWRKKADVRVDESRYW